MKLELKHLAPYLPYGLKYISQDEEFPESMDGLFVNEEVYSAEFGENDFTHIKPLLRPLSDLTMNGYDGKPLLFPSHQLIKHIERGQDIFNCDYNEINYLIRNHFDVFNLIPNNLALDINTIDK